MQFDHALLRALYGLMGLAGCVMIFTGNLVWVTKRAACQGHRGAAWVQAVNVAAFAGLPLASVTTMLLNTLPASWWTFGASPLDAAAARIASRLRRHRAAWADTRYAT